MVSHAHMHLFHLLVETAELTYPRDKDFITVVLRVALETPGPNGSVTATAVPVVWQVGG